MKRRHSNGILNSSQTKIEILGSFYSSMTKNDVDEKKNNAPLRGQYYATLTSLNLFFDLQKVKDDRSCFFSSNDITRKYWVDFLQENYFSLNYCVSSLYSAIRDDIFTMFENDFSLCGSNDKATIESKKELYNDLYKRQFGNRSLSPYTELVDAFLEGIKTGNWLSFDGKCYNFQTQLDHLGLYRCDSFEKLQLRPSCKLMISFAGMRHQLKDSSDTLGYHVIWQQSQKTNRQLSLLYPPVKEFLSWLKSHKPMRHVVFHVSSAHFNKLILTKYNFEEKLPKLIIKIPKIKKEDKAATAKAIAMSLKVPDFFSKKINSDMLLAITIFLNFSDQTNISALSKFFLAMIHINPRFRKEKEIFSEFTQYISDKSDPYPNPAPHQKFHIRKKTTDMIMDGLEKKLFTMDLIVSWSLSKDLNILWLLLPAILSHDNRKQALKKKLFTMEEVIILALTFPNRIWSLITILLSDTGIQFLGKKLTTLTEITDLLNRRVCSAFIIERLFKRLSKNTGFFATPDFKKLGINFTDEVEKELKMYY